MCAVAGGLVLVAAVMAAVMMVTVVDRFGGVVMGTRDAEMLVLVRRSAPLVPSVCTAASNPFDIVAFTLALPSVHSTAAPPP
jgi:hypothetical protein